MNWYRQVFLETDETRQLAIISDACAYYEDQYPAALETIKEPEGLIVKLESKLPGLAAENEMRVRDLEVMLKHLENMENCARKRRFQYYMEHYNRNIKETTAKIYAEADDEVQTIRAIRYRVASVSNMFVAISKGLEYMHYQLSNITRLRAAGLEDAEF